MESTHKHHATGRCPYCGSAFDKTIPHTTHLVGCDDCKKLFVAQVSYATEIYRVEGEASRYTGLSVRAVKAYERAAA